MTALPNPGQMLATQARLQPNRLGARDLERLSGGEAPDATDFSTEGGRLYRKAGSGRRLRRLEFCGRRKTSGFASASEATAAACSMAPRIFPWWGDLLHTGSALAGSPVSM